MTERTLIVRGQVKLARLGARTLLQVTGLDGDTFSDIELLLPPGFVALPEDGADILLLSANGVRGHSVAVAGDNIADRVADLQAGEFGIATNGKRVILRQDFIEIVDPAAVNITAPNCTITASAGCVIVGNATVVGNAIVTGDLAVGE